MMPIKFNYAYHPGYFSNLTEGNFRGGGCSIREVGNAAELEMVKLRKRKQLALSSTDKRWWSLDLILSLCPWSYTLKGGKKSHFIWIRELHAHVAVNRASRTQSHFLKAPFSQNRCRDCSVTTGDWHQSCLTRRLLRRWIPHRRGPLHWIMGIRWAE